MKNQEILNALNEKIKAAEEALLYLNQTKAGLERVIANSKKSPVEEAYKRVYGFYPETYSDTWSAFQDGYEEAQKDYKVEEPQEPPQELEQDYWDYKKEKEAKALQEKNWSYKVTDECGETNPYKQYFNSLDKEEYPYKKYTPEETEESLKKSFREAVKQGVVSSVDKPKPDTLYDLIADWWDEIFTNGNPSGQNIESLVEQIMELIPPPLDEICGIDGYNRGWTRGYNYYRATLLERFNGK